MVWMLARGHVYLRVTREQQVSYMVQLRWSALHRVYSFGESDDDDEDNNEDNNDDGVDDDKDGDGNCGNEFADFVLNFL